MLNISPNKFLISLIFWSTLLIYQLNTKLKINIADFSSLKKLGSLRRKRMTIYMIIVIIIFGHIPFLDIYSILFIAHLGLISTLYNVPEKSYYTSVIPLRSIPILKVFLIAYVWASISSILPALGNGHMGNGPIWMIFTAHFLFILSITLPFDIRDFRTDRKYYLITVPHLVGIKKTKFLSIIFLLAFTVIIVSLTKTLLIVILSFITAYLIINSNPYKKDYYFTLFIDATIILYFIIVKISVV
jgi:4-hydroxybenzoate polyprenyltransferase